MDADAQRSPSDDNGPSYGTPLEHEAEIWAAFEALPERALAELASSTLAVVLEETGSTPALWTTGDKQHQIRLQAAMVGAIRAFRAFRAVRAGMAVLGHGYEIEADTMSRVLLELAVETRTAIDDLSGETARSWLAGERGYGISKRVRAAMPHRPETYGGLSRAAHGDPRALMGLAVAEEGGPVVEWGPRQTDATARCLIGLAVAARDMAVMLEEVTGQRSAALDALDQVLAAQVNGWAPGADWSADSSPSAAGPS
ncbi:MAG TPA: hypothetical protein VFY45_13510 [Baekduia sp.]|nr:hypothetical protein [Baekduia sp.]